MNKERLINLRENRGWTKTETARRLNIANSTYSSYEYGHRRPDGEMLIKMSNLFDVTTDYLLGNDKQHIDSFDDLDVLMFSDKEDFDSLSEEEQQEIKDMINDQLDFLIQRKKKDK